MMREPRGASEKFHEVLPGASGKRPNTTERGKDDYSLIEGLEVVIGQFQLPEHPSHGFDIAVRLNQMGAEQVETQPVSLAEIWMPPRKRYSSQRRPVEVQRKGELVLDINTPEEFVVEPKPMELTPIRK